MNPSEARQGAAGRPWRFQAAPSWRVPTGRSRLAVTLPTDDHWPRTAPIRKGDGEDHLRVDVQRRIVEEMRIEVAGLDHADRASHDFRFVHPDRYGRP